MTAFDTEPKKEKTWFDYAKTGVIILMILIIIIVPVSCFIPNSPTLRWILHALEWLQSQPLWLKGTIMVLILAIGIPIGGPVTPLELCSGFIFGFWLGSFFAGLGMTLGAIICFFWGKYLLIEWSEQQQREKKLVRAICYAVRKEALKLVVLCRLSPILPTFMMNYLFATTGMSFGTYLLGSILGDFPWVFAYCYIGSLSKSLADAFNDSGGSKTTQIIFLVVGITATAILLIVVTYIGKREIKKAMDELDALDQESIPLKSESQSNYTSTNASSPLLSGGSYGSNDYVSNNIINNNFSYNKEENKKNYDEGADLLYPNYIKKDKDERREDLSSPFAQSAPLGSTSPFESSMPIPSPSFFAQSAPLSPAPFSQSSPLSSAFSQSSPLSSPFSQSSPLAEPLSSPFSQSSPLSLSSPFSQSSPLSAPSSQSSSLSSAFSQSTPLPAAFSQPFPLPAPNVYVAPVEPISKSSDHSSDDNSLSDNHSHSSPSSHSQSSSHSSYSSPSSYSSSHSSSYSSSHHDGGGSGGGDSGGGGGGGGD